jgi:hypothetical protein
MVAATIIKTFQIKDYETGQTFDIEMSILDYIKYRQINELIKAIRRVK